MGVERLRLGDDAEVPTLRHEHVDLAEELGPRCETAPGLSRALRHCTHLLAAIVHCGDDEVLLRQLRAGQHYDALPDLPSRRHL